MSYGAACKKCRGYIGDWGLCEADAEALQSQLAEREKEIERLKSIFTSQEGMYRDLLATQDDLHHEMKGTEILTAERDSLKAENERLKTNKHLVTSDEGTSYCAQCERYAREAARFREALGAISGCLNDATMDGSHIKLAKRLAEQALSDAKPRTEGL